MKQWRWGSVWDDFGGAISVIAMWTFELYLDPRLVVEVDVWHTSVLYMRAHTSAVRFSPSMHCETHRQDARQSFPDCKS